MHKCSECGEPATHHESYWEQIDSDGNADYGGDRYNCAKHSHDAFHLIGECEDCISSLPWIHLLDSSQFKDRK